MLPTSGTSTPSFSITSNLEKELSSMVGKHMVGVKQMQRVIGKLAAKLNTKTAIDKLCKPDLR